MHDRISVNTLCFMGSPFADLIGIWRDLAAHRVSLVSTLLFDEGLEVAQTALATGDYPLEALSHQFHAGPMDRDEANWEQARSRLSKVIADTKKLGGQVIYMVTGGHGSQTWEEAAECFAAAIAPCLPEAEAAGIPLLIEPSPPVYVHSNLSHTLRDAVTLAEMAGIGVCIDMFAAWSEAGLDETIRRAMPRCHLVQVGDYVLGDRSLPARAAIGDGTIPIARICDWILSAGYKGRFDLELLGPRIDAEGRVAAVARSADRLGEILLQLGV